MLEECLTKLQVILHALTKIKVWKGRAEPPPPPPFSGASEDDELEPKGNKGYRGPNPYQLGKGFTVLRHLWGSLSIELWFTMPLVKPDLPPDDPVFFKKKDEKLCVLAAHVNLFDYVPQHFHSILHSPTRFQTEVCCLSSLIVCIALPTHIL